MAIYQPYFYVIQDKRNDIYYAGSKYGKDANPSNFMKPNGYLTSSNIVSEIIREHGIDTFCIRILRMFDTIEEVYSYETKFLRKVNAKNNSKFYNRHNNDHIFSYHDERYKAKMIEVYGVDDPMKSSVIIDRIVASNMNSFSVPWPMMSETVKEKSRKTLNENYGVDNPMHSEDIKEKLRLSNLEAYGVENAFQAEWVKEKIKKTNLEKYGAEHPMHSEEIKERMAKTNLEKYGVVNTFQSESSKAKIKERADYLLSRPELNIIRAYQKKHRIRIGAGWVRKSDEFINNLLKDLRAEYGPI